MYKQIKKLYCLKGKMLDSVTPEQKGYETTLLSAGVVSRCQASLIKYVLMLRRGVPAGSAPPAVQPEDLLLGERAPARPCHRRVLRGAGGQAVR